jgi:Uma2 family endonuclease
MKYGVKEYWIINPMLESVTIYTLNNENMYEQLDMKTSTGIVKSKVLESFTVNLKDIFQ